MASLLPLRSIPFVARANEAAARRMCGTRSEAITAAEWEIVDAEGCHSGARPATRGWCLTQAAAEAVAAEVVRMPGGTVHHHLAVRHYPS
jgi:hypothetical protein